MTEETLMAAYCEGDRKAFEQLLGLLGPRLHGFFMRSFNNCSMADDLMQTTLLKVHRARSEYRRDLPLRPWIFGIAARVRLDEYRRQRKLAEDLDEEALARAEEGGGDAEVASARPEAGERAAQVRAAIAALPESQRVIVHLHRFEGMTFVEIARALETSEGAVKQRAFRAYERLRRALKPLLQREETR
jgi:RNA polymerase sigma-70 factor (ECF subfamily)